MKNLIQKWNSISLVLRILCGLIVGIILGLCIPKVTVIAILGDLFVGALKAIAPLLVFFLVMSALAHMGEGQKTNMGFIVALYMLGNLFSALVAVIAWPSFPSYFNSWKSSHRRCYSSERSRRSIKESFAQCCVQSDCFYRKCELYRYSCMGMYLWYRTQSCISCNKESVR